MVPPSSMHALVVDRFVDRRDVGEIQLGQALLGALVRHEGRARILERLAAGDVIVVMVAVDHVADRRAGDLPDLVDIGGDRLRPVAADRVGGDDARGRHDEHRLMALVAEDVDVVGALDLGGGEQRRRGRAPVFAPARGAGSAQHAPAGMRAGQVRSVAWSLSFQVRVEARGPPRGSRRPVHAVMMRRLRSRGPTARNSAAPPCRGRSA